MTTIGIDPGKSGGIAWITDGKPCVEKMPGSLRDLWDLICDITNHPRSTVDGRKYKAYIEQVHSSPQMGVKSAFTFGQSFGHVLGILDANQVPYLLVRPQKWQQQMGCLTKGDKNVSKAEAQRRWPFMRITHANADSLLIAEWARTQGWRSNV